MPYRIPRHQLVVHRDGKNLYVPIGKPFDFTPEEIEWFLAHNLHSLRRVIREAVPAVAEVTSDDAPPVPAAPKKVVGGKRPQPSRQNPPAEDDDHL